MLTKAQARQEIREAIDDPQGKRWSDSALDNLTSRTLDALWSEVLDMAPWILTQFETPVPTSPGYLDMRTFGNGGQFSQRLYRIQKVTRNEQTLRPVDQRDVVLSEDGLSGVVVPDASYTQFGSQLWSFPLDMTQDVQVYYNFLPTAYRDLADDTTVPWPDGYEDAFIYGTARRAFAKGDAESIEQATALYSESMALLRNAVKKLAIGPMTPFVVDTPIDWGT